MGRVEFCKDTPNLSSQRQPSGFSLGYEPRFGRGWRSICPLSLARTYLFYIEALLRYNIECRLSRRFILPAKFRLHAAPEGKLPRAEALCMRVCEGRKETSTGSRSDQYCSRRRPVLVTIAYQYYFAQRPVLVTFPSSLRAYYSPPTDGVAGGSGGSRILA